MQFYTVGILKYYTGIQRLLILHESLRSIVEMHVIATVGAISL